MNTAKKIIIVITLAILAFIVLAYVIATKSMIGTSNNSPIIFLQSENNSNNNVEANLAKLVNDEENDRTKITVTSRSGKHEPLNTISEEVALVEDASAAETDASSTAETVTEEVSVEETPVAISDEIIEEETSEESEAPIIVEEERPSFEGVELEYSATYNITSAHLTKSKGAIYYNGHKETYYSQRVLPGKGLTKLNNNGRHVADDGTIRDGDGYIAVACNYLSKGSEIMTSLGPGKVYDTGGMTGKWIDIYVNW